MSLFPGLNVSAIVTEAADSKNFNSDKRDETVETIAGHMVDTTDMQLNLSRAGLKQRGCCGLMGGTYVTVIYLVSKLLYLVNVIGQFFILNSFLKKGHGEFWGASVLNDVVHGRTWEESGHFPR